MDAGRANELRQEGIWMGLRLGLETCPSCLLVVDAEGTIRIANTAAREIFDYSPAELDSWSKRIAAQVWEEAFVFFKHEQIAPDLAARMAAG